MTDTISARLRKTTEAMASQCSVPQTLWQDHSTAALTAADHIGAQRAKIKALEADREHLLRLYDGVKAISQYGADTLSGPSEPKKPDAEWYRIGVVEMRQRAARLLWGNVWNEPIDEWSKRWSEEMDATLSRAKTPSNEKTPPRS